MDGRVPPSRHSPRALPALLAAAAFLSTPLPVSAGVQHIPHGKDSPLGDRWFRTLPNGNIVVADPAYGTTDARNLGAVSLFRPDGTLIQRVEGTHQDDALGSGGITVLDNGHFVVSSPGWGGGTFSRAGAVTRGHAEQGLPTAISASNSLVGDSSGDQVGGGGVYALGNGHYVVISRDWGAGTAASVGAMTWARSDGSTVGTVTAANSLVGRAARDFGGAELFRFPEGNAVVLLPEWNNGPVSNAGALLWLAGDAPTTGSVSAANALVGATADDFRDALLTPAPDGHVVLSAPYWDAPNGVDAGAIIVATGALPRNGAIGGSNAFIGARANDRLGYGVVHPDYRGVVALANGDLAIISPNFWTNSGAVHRIANSSSSVGVAGTDNMIGGRYANEYVGSGGVLPLANGGIVVLSPRAWSQPTNRLEAGAVTMAPPAFGRIELSATNSTFGRVAEDRWGSGGAIELSDGRVLVGSPNVDDAGLADAGAIGVVGPSSSGGIDPSDTWFGNAAGARLGAMDLFRYHPRWAALPNGEALVAVPAFSVNGVSRSGVLHVRADTPRGTIGTNNVVPMPGTAVATVALAGGRFAAVFSEGLAFDVGGRFPPDVETHPGRLWLPRSGEAFSRALPLSSGRLAVLSSGNTWGATLSLSNLAPTQPAATVDSSNSLLGLSTCFPHLAELAGGRFVLYSASGFPIGCNLGTHVLASTSSSLAPTARDWEQAEGDVVSYDGDSPSPPTFDPAADRLTFGRLGGVVRMTLDGAGRPPRWLRFPSLSGTTELRADAEAIDPDGDAIRYEFAWFRGNFAIAGETAAQYRVRASDRGERIAVRVDAFASGGETLSAFSDQVLVPANRAPRITSLVVLGTPEVGEVMTAAAAADDPDGDAVDLRYRWLREDASEAGQGVSYTVKAADAGTTLTVVASATDGSDAASLSRTITIGTPLPRLADDAFTVDGPVFEIPAPGILANDSDLGTIDRRSVDVVRIESADSLLSVVALPDGRVRGISQRNGDEPAIVTYRVCSDPAAGRCREATLTLTRRSMLRAVPEAVRVRTGGAQVAIRPLTNDLWPAGSGDQLRLTVVSSTAGTRLAIVDDGFLLTPSATPGATDVIRYRVCITDGRCSEADVTVPHGPGPVASVGDGATRGQATVHALRSTSGLEAHVSAYAPVAALESTRRIWSSSPAADPLLLPEHQRHVYIQALDNGRPGVRYRYFIDSPEPIAVGIDFDGDDHPDPAEQICTAQPTGPSMASERMGDWCEFDSGPWPSGARRFWVVGHVPVAPSRGVIGEHDVRLRIYAVPLEETAAASAWRVDRRDGADVASRIHLAWDRSDFGRIQPFPLGLVRYRRAGQEDEWLPFFLGNTPMQRPVAIASGTAVSIQAVPVANPGEATHFFDVPPGTRKLVVEATANEPFDIRLLAGDLPSQRPTTPVVPPASIDSRILLTGGGDPGRKRIELLGPPPGRYFLLPTTGSTLPTFVEVGLAIEASPPSFRPGSYFNPQRSGHGMFVYPSGDQWVALWYTYRPDGDATWFYAQARAPGANGIWRAPLYRSTWKTGRNHLAPAGHLTLTPTGPDRATVAYTLDGITGSEPLEPLGRGCPTIDGRSSDRSGQWFNPQRAGTGYSVQLLPNYEFYVAFGYGPGGDADFRIAEIPRLGPATTSTALESLSGFCPHCERASAPARRTAGTLARTLLPDGGFRFAATEAPGEAAGSTWTFDEAAVPLGPLQGCDP